LVKSENSKRALNVTQQLHSQKERPRFSHIRGFCSDLMSDVLTLETDMMLLITGMANLQTIRTAEMADIHYVLLDRNKKATEEMVKLAVESGIVLLETGMSSFRCCGILYSAGLKPVY
jgi:hypothetical protein